MKAEEARDISKINCLLIAEDIKRIEAIIKENAEIGKYQVTVDFENDLCNIKRYFEDNGFYCEYMAFNQIMISW